MCGDRNWDDEEAIETFFQNHPEITEVIEGGASGADTMARHAAEFLGIPVKEYKATWEKYGRAAGPIRNRQMLDEKPDLVVAFHHDLSKSKGTKDTVTEARKRGIPVKVIGERGGGW